MEFQAREIHRARFPLWDPYIWCGQSLIGQTQPGPLFPLNIAFSLLPLDKDGYLRNDTLNWYYAIVHFLAALFAYLLCRELRLPEAASILGGILFGFGGFLGTVPWTDVMNGAIFAPIVLLYVVRTARGKRPLADASLAGFWLGLSWLSGHHELPLMLSVIVAATWIWLRQFRYGAICLVITGLIAAVQLWPTYEFAHLSKRWVGTEKEAAWNDRVPYTIHTVYSLPPSGVVETMLPNTKTYADVAPFLGGVAVSLALLGLAANWRERHVRWLAAIAAVSVIYALGAFTPLHGLVYSISPMMARARVPVRAILFWNFALAILAAYGLDAPAEWMRRVGKFMAWVGSLILGACVYWMYAGPAASERLWLTGLCFAAGSAIAITGRYRLALIGLALVELTPYATGWYPHLTEGRQVKFASMLTRDRDIADFLRGQPGRGRVAINYDDLPANFGDWHAIEMLHGYVAGAPTWLIEGYMHTERFQQIANVTHFIGKQPARPNQVEVFTGASGVKVFRVPDPMPRAWAIHNAVSVKSNYEAGARVQDPDFDFRTTVSLPGDAPRMDSCGGDAVKVTRHAANRVTIHASMACRGMVVLGDSWYPEWKAKIDGRDAPIYQAFGMMRGVAVDGGEHEIDMRYLPTSVLAGAALTLLGLAVVTIVTVKSRKPLI
jgi:hypothetical protein